MNWTLPANFGLYLTLWVMFFTFIFMWYQGRLPSTGVLQDLTTILNSRGGNILILSAASVYFFYHAEHMYYVVVQLINGGVIKADNGIALNGLLFDTGAFGSAFGALLKTMSPEAISPPGAGSVTLTSTAVTKTSTAIPAEALPITNSSGAVV